MDKDTVSAEAVTGILFWFYLETEKLIRCIRSETSSFLWDIMDAAI